MYTTQKIRQSVKNADETDQSVENNERPDEEYENKEVPSPIKTEKPLVNAIGVIGCNSTVLRIGEDSVCSSFRLT